MAAQAFLGFAFLLGVLAAALFASAGTFDYWQAWAFLVVFGVATLIIDEERALSRELPGYIEYSATR